MLSAQGPVTDDAQAHQGHGLCHDHPGLQQQIEAHYREAAVFALSSRYEGMPIVLLEAQALGVPAVAFDCPTGPGEILTPDTGRLVPVGDVQALAESLIELLSSSELRAQMGRAAIARSRELFGPQRHVASALTRAR